MRTALRSYKQDNEPRADSLIFNVRHDDDRRKE